MSEPTQPPGDLRFDKVAGLSGSPTCADCRQPIRDAYYDVNGQVLCEQCRRRAEANWNAGSASGRFAKALVLGLGAAAAGTGLYYAVLALTGYEFGLIAIVVGFLVGAAVRKGANGRGGRKYQVLAMFLTYSAIVASYVPLIGPKLDPQDVALIFALPFLAGVDNVIGLVIIGIALYEAWKLNQRAELRIAGPFMIGGAARPPLL